MTTSTNQHTGQPPQPAAPERTEQTPPQHQPTRTIPFTKMHGLANDYIFINAIKHPHITQNLNLKQLAINISNRRTGVGADGLIILEPLHPTNTDQHQPTYPKQNPQNHHAQAVDAEVRMRMLNADGSIGEMCGNGARCLAALAAQTIKQQHPTTNPTHIRIHTGHLSPRTVTAQLLNLPTPSNSTPHTTPHSTPHTTTIQIDMGTPHIDHHPIWITQEGHLRRGFEAPGTTADNITEKPTPTGTLQSRSANDNARNRKKITDTRVDHLTDSPSQGGAGKTKEQRWPGIETEQRTGGNHERLHSDQERELILVSMGNPHAVVFVDSESQAESLVRSLGPIIQNHPYFPGGVNLHSAVVVAEDHLLMRTWERGSGYTHACGSGACAVLAAALHKQHINPPNSAATITLPGGQLHIAQHPTTHNITMIGPATTVCEGYWQTQPSEHTP